MTCINCGQANIADGGIGCTCGTCRCNGGNGECFMCERCTVCGRSAQSHMKAICCKGHVKKIIKPRIIRNYSTPEARKFWERVEEKYGK